MNRAGLFPFLLLLLFTALVSVAGALAFYMARGESIPLSYGNGLSAVYAAESGANWGLEALRNGVEPKGSVILEEGERKAKVRIVPYEGKVKISSVGTDRVSGVQRKVTLVVHVEEQGEARSVFVESVTSE